MHTTSSCAIGESRINLVIPWRRAERDTLYIHRSKKFPQKSTHAFFYCTFHVLLCVWKQHEAVAKTLGMYVDRTMLDTHCRPIIETNSHMIYPPLTTKSLQHTPHSIF